MNERFSELIQNFRISEAYAKIVTAKPFKVLSCFVFDWTYAPLKRGGLEAPRSPKATSVLSRKGKKKKPGPPLRLSTSVGETTMSCLVQTPTSSTSPSDIDLTEEDEKQFLHPSHR